MVRTIRFLHAKAVLTIVLGLLVAACETAPRIGRVDLLDFIQDGRTTREQTYLQLGEPAGSYENGRVLAYRLGKDAGGSFIVAKALGFKGATTNLMLVFDERGVLSRHSLVQIKAP